MAVNPGYEEFEPFCKWQRGEEQDIIGLHLHGFKRDQVRVQLTNLGIIVVSGERLLDEGRGSRFRKEIRVSKDCKTNEIHAHMTNSILYVVMPKRAPSVLPSTQDQPTVLSQSSQEKEVAKPRTEDHNNVADHTATKPLSAGECSTGITLVKPPSCNSSKVWRIGSVMKLTIVIALLVGLVATVMHKYLQAPDIM
ncbi:hypothetical protein K2173_025592 [Erythroxylum novogranatense]|uniref:SHSP domain-containing protein n=1 Tax=Erythroxylum novogranatense TaxID=1862640 RepID=A0AAV8T8S0_9ROSI|nr:hypothetical protein K2173_025592 [Erythroxylum novogranatense]